MSELRDDTTEDGFHEIQFTRKQLVFLFMTASALVILVFILGILTGRGMANRGEDAPVGAESAALEPAPVPGDQPSPPSDPSGAIPGGLTYPESLGANTSGAKPKPAEQPPVTAVPIVTEEPPASKPAVTVEPPPAKPPAAEVNPPAPDATAKVPTSGRPGVWVIQVMALRTRQPAVELVQSLRSKGYDAFLESPAQGVYRVRVGRFRQRSEAEQIARRLQREERLTPVISR